jgi:glycosyltransferase involved in cell wall biosynthesis
MKIAIDARIINSSTGRYIERLVHYLEELDHENQYLILVRKKDLSFYTPHNPNFRIVEADFPDYSRAEQIGFAKLLRALKPDLVHFCMPQQPLLYRGVSVTTVHDLNLLRITSNDDMNFIELHIKKLIFRMLLYRVVRRTQHVITPTQFTRDDLIDFSHIPFSKVTVTYEGADKADTHTVPIPALQNVRFIMYVGRAEPYKNNRGLIEAHQQLLQKYPDLKLVIVGRKDSLRQTDMAWVKKRGYTNIEFVGFVEETQLGWLYQHCAVYVFASFMEGFGLPGLEAMAYGAPVASSNATCLPEVYGNAAEYFDPHNRGDMVAAIDKIMSNPKRREQLIEKGYKVHGKYSWPRMAKQTLAVYKEVTSKT